MLITDIHTHRANAKNVILGFRGPHKAKIDENLHFDFLPPPKRKKKELGPKIGRKFRPKTIFFLPLHG